MSVIVEEMNWSLPREDHPEWCAPSSISNSSLSQTFEVSHFDATDHAATQLGSIVPCPPPMPTPEELSHPSSPNSVVESVASQDASTPNSPEEVEAENNAESNEDDGNYSESEEKPRKRRGRKRKLGTDDPEQLKQIHNQNEKKRRADQRKLFAQLRKVVPGVEEQAQKTVVLQRVYEYLRQQEHTIEVQRKKLLTYESQLGITQERPTASPKGSAASRAARGARRSSVAEA